MAVTGTPISFLEGLSREQILKVILAHPKGKLYGIDPNFGGRITRKQLEELIAFVYRGLSSHFYNVNTADLTLTTARSYDLSASNPRIKIMLELLVLQSESGSYVASNRWDYDYAQQILNLHTKPIDGITTKVIYSAPFDELTGDESTVEGDLVDKEHLIVDGVFGMLGDRDSRIIFEKDRATLQSSWNGKMTFPRKRA